MYVVIEEWTPITRLDRGRADVSPPHRCFAVRPLPGWVTAQQFLTAVRAIGGQDYFKRTNLRGELRPANDVVAGHLVLQ